jgi:uncharacterized protein (DUF2062 family)
LQDPNLWHLNRRSASGGVAVGLFMMYMPPFGQVFMAAAAAIKLRVNLPISASAGVAQQPADHPADVLLRLCGRRGPHSAAVRAFEPEFWLDWHNWLGVLGPVLLGCLICATRRAAIGYFAVQACGAGA